MNWISRPDKDGIWLWRLSNSRYIGIMEMLDGKITSRSVDDSGQEWIAAEEWLAVDLALTIQYCFVGVEQLCL